MNIKKTIRSVVVFWGIFTLLLCIYLIVSFKGIPEDEAYATTWIDQNANGIKENNEAPLPNVCIWSSHSGFPKYFDPCEDKDHETTSDTGQWYRFLPGDTCDNTYVFVKAPEGYQPTTNLAANGCDAKFGFISKDVKVEKDVLSVQSFIRRTYLTTWLKIIFIGLVVLFICTTGTVWLQKE